MWSLNYTTMELLIRKQTWSELATPVRLASCSSSSGSTRRPLSSQCASLTRAATSSTSASTVTPASDGAAMSWCTTPSSPPRTPMTLASHRPPSPPYPKPFLTGGNHTTWRRATSVR
uniref:Uncharacterized protein n=1 Tax=Oryza meridionalis TaxID=40149 RepID=A0A0E0CA36_9ORYZ